VTKKINLNGRFYKNTMRLIHSSTVAYFFLDHPVHRIHTYGLIPPSTENFSVPETSIVIAIVDLVAVSTKQSIKRVRIMEDLMINVRKYSVIY